MCSWVENVVATLRTEERQLEAKLTKVRSAIMALAGDNADTTQTATRVAKKARRMSAAQKKAVSERMKKYWAARKKKAAKKKVS